MLVLPSLYVCYAILVKLCLILFGPNVIKPAKQQKMNGR